MEAFKWFAVVLVVPSLIFLVGVGALEVYNKTLVSSVMRPWVAAVGNSVSADYEEAEVREGSKRAQGIPEGRLHK